MHAALRAFAFGGTVALVAWHNEIKGGLDFGREAHFNRPRFVFPRVESEPHHDHPRWSATRPSQTAWELLASGKLDWSPIIQPMVSFDDAAEAYREYVGEYPERSMKLGLRFGSL